MSLNLKALSLLLSLMLVMFQDVSAAPKELPTVNWSADVLPMDDRNPFLNFPGVRQRIAKAITEKLHTLQREGKLPFKLKETDTDYGTHVIIADDPIGIIPLSTLDRSFDTSFHVNGKTYYKSIVFSGLSFAVISADALNNSWKILATIPLNAHHVIGSDFRETPIKIEEKADKFAEITVKMINESLDFNDRKLFQDIEMKSLWPDTYQVTEVNITSQKAQQIFKGRENEVKEIIAAFFTESYQNKTRRIVYPPRGGGNWKQDVGKNLYTFRTNTPTGEMSFSIENPKHSITLEFSGVANQEISLKDKSKVVRDIFYKVWLKKHPVEDNEAAEFTHHEIVREVKTGNAWIGYDPADVFLRTAMVAAVNMGRQKN